MPDDLLPTYARMKVVCCLKELKPMQILTLASPVSCLLGMCFLSYVLSFLCPFQSMWILGIASNPLKSLLTENCLEMMLYRSICPCCIPVIVRLYLHLRWSKARCIFRQCLNRSCQKCAMLSHGDKAGCTGDFSPILRARLGVVGSTEGMLMWANWNGGGCST